MPTAFSMTSFSFGISMIPRSVKLTVLRDTKKIEEIKQLLEGTKTEMGNTIKSYIETNK